MIKKILFCIGLLVICISCQNKPKNLVQPDLSSLDINIDETVLSYKLDSTDLNLLPRLTQLQYDSLQLNLVTDLKGYDLGDLSMGRVLLASENGKIITIQIITGGEVSEYLLSYDRNGTLTDNLLVAYEDMVEYYSQISSNIKANKITVQTINYTYEDESGNPIEKSDTALMAYEITPDLKFVKN